jgi:hypothetical protein
MSATHDAATVTHPAPRVRVAATPGRASWFFYRGEKTAASEDMQANSRARGAVRAVVTSESPSTVRRGIGTYRALE